jgi:hypothetical protein
MDHRKFSREHRRIDHACNRLHSKNGLLSRYRIECAKFLRRNSCKKNFKIFFWSKRNGRASYLNRLKCISNIPKFHKYQTGKDRHRIAVRNFAARVDRKHRWNRSPKHRAILYCSDRAALQCQQSQCKPPNNFRSRLSSDAKSGSSGETQIRLDLISMTRNGIDVGDRNDSRVIHQTIDTRGEL